MVIKFNIQKDAIHKVIHDEFMNKFPESNFIPSKTGGFHFETTDFWLSAGYGILTYNHHVIMPQFSAFIMYSELESLILPILRKHKLMGGKPNDLVHGFSKLFPEEYAKPPYAFEKEISILCLDDIQPVADKFLFFFENAAIPYFEKCADLSYVWSIVKKLEGREANSSYMGPFWEFYRCGLMKCLDVSGAKEYALAYKNKRREIAEKPPDAEVAIQYYEASKDLLELMG